ncbi:alpha/beta hydrolase [Paenibacillus sambharensis]|uniref:Alpha/beta hydrolase n=1 Tax=Paenibacillus sambharensis TaxID=1803190 RepID=A0A2W1LI73_9BACL|nr:alpha/beta hydrolase [Paenibacillus sambharensis]PZD94742.1 alpha/beta hydrolase [Paenibacillus sambharensis]
MKEYKLKTNNHYVRYHDFPGEAAPILFLHGLGCAGSFDFPQVAAQPELSGHRRILVDMLGAGFSDKPADFLYDVNSHAEYLLELITSLELHDFILFGHSFGGAVALSLADKCRDRLRSVILSEANLDNGGGFVSRVIADYNETDFVEYGFDEVISKNRRAADKLWAASLSVWSPLAAHRVSKSLVEGQSPSWRDIFYSLTCSKTFIFGERSLPDPDVQELSGRDIHIEIVKQAGHSMAWENPQGLAAAIKSGIANSQPKTI